MAATISILITTLMHGVMTALVWTVSNRVYNSTLKAVLRILAVAVIISAVAGIAETIGLGEIIAERVFGGLYELF